MIILVGGTVGCIRPNAPADAVRSSLADQTSSDLDRWRLVDSGLPDAATPQPSADDQFARFDRSIEGPPGFARVTLITDRTIAGQPTVQYLNDVLFSVGGATRLGCSIDQVRSEFRFDVRSEGEDSVARINLKAPLDSAQPAGFEAFELTSSTISGNRETNLGRWTWRDGPAICSLTLRILLSREAVSPRLKPEGKPPR